MEGIRADVEQKGAIPRSFEHIFGHISNANIEEQYLVRASYLG
jgi:kinesin family protein 3/17